MEAILSAKGVTKRFGGLVAVNAVDFELRKGEIVGIIGPNGAGKTTFFNCVTGQYSPTEGQIFYRDKEITGLKPFEITKLGMCRTFQNIRLFADMTALENVMVGAHTRTNVNLLDVMFKTKRFKESERAMVEKAEEMLRLTGLYDYKHHYATGLPYGYQRRLEIARAMASSPEVLLFDEPAAGMNEQETNDLMNFMLELQQMGYTILLIEHDMRLVMNVCNRIYVFDHGVRIAHGKAEEIKCDPLVIEAYLGKGTE